MLGKNLGTIALCLAAMAAVAQAEDATRLSSLHWDEETLILGFDGPYTSSNMTLYDPDRIVLDFPAVRANLHTHIFSGPTGVSGVRVGQNEADEQGGLRCRVVLDLNEPRSFLCEEGEQILSVTLSESPQNKESAVTPRELPLVAEEAPRERTLIAEEAPRELPLIAEEAPQELPLIAEEAPRELTLVEEEAPRELPPIAEEAPQELPLIAEEAQLDAMAPLPDEKPASLSTSTQEEASSENLSLAAARMAAARTAALIADQADSSEAPAGEEEAADKETEESINKGGESVHVSAEEPVAVVKVLAASAGATSQTPVVGKPVYMTGKAEKTTGTVRTAAETDVVEPVESVVPSAGKTAHAAPVLEASMNSPAVSGSVVEQASWSKAVVQDSHAEKAAGMETPLRQVADASEGSLSVKVEQVRESKASSEQKAPARAIAAKTAAVKFRRPGVKPDETPITLEMRGAEFRTLLRAFSEFSGLNIICGRDVKGKVSVQLKQVPWREALLAVCSAHGYGVVEEHEVLRIAPRATLASEEMEKLNSEKKRLEYHPLVTKVVSLHYATASELSASLGKMLSGRGKIDVDARTNSLLITDLQDYVERLECLVRELDRIMPQVEIMARIVDVDYRASRDMGIRWEAINIASHSVDATGSAVVDGTFPEPIGEFKLGTIRDFGELNLTIQALEKENKANIISNPRIMTMDNREASILVGKKIPLIVADEAGNAITQLTTIGIKLQVTPHINPDGKIMMNVVTEVSDLSSEATVQGGVIITTSESMTNVMVDDGETAVIAGLIKSSESSLGSTVPWLGRIPILGHLFGYNNKSQDKRELIIFITPRVVNDPGVIDSVSYENVWQETGQGS